MEESCTHSRTVESCITDLDVQDFQELGAFAGAGLEAVKLALERAHQSLTNGRIPISGAAVELTKSGKLQVVTVGVARKYINRISSLDTGRFLGCILIDVVPLDLLVVWIQSTTCFLLHMLSSSASVR